MSLIPFAIAAAAIYFLIAPVGAVLCAKHFSKQSKNFYKDFIETEGEVTGYVKNNSNNLYHKEITFKTPDGQKHIVKGRTGTFYKPASAIGTVVKISYNTNNPKKAYDNMSGAQQGTFLILLILSYFVISVTLSVISAIALAVIVTKLS